MVDIRHFKDIVWWTSICTAPNDGRRCDECCPNSSWTSACKMLQASAPHLQAALSEPFASASTW